MVLSEAQTEELRAALKDMKGKLGIGAARLLREFQVENPGEPCLSRSALDKFTAWPEGVDNKAATKTGHTRKPEALAALYAFLRGHEVYAAHLDAPPAATPADFAAALSRFFTDVEPKTVLASRDAQAALPGSYVVYRPDWKTLNPRIARVSLLKIEAVSGGFVVTDTQNDPNAGKEPYRQHDAGGVFFYGKYAYLLTRESGGGLVQFWVVSDMFPDTGMRQPLEFFRGMTTGASFADIFPRDKFFCSRIDPERPPPLGVMAMGKIKDTRALDYLNPPAQVRKTAKADK